MFTRSASSSALVARWGSLFLILGVTNASSFYSVYDTAGGIILPMVTTSAKLSWFSSARWTEHGSVPSNNDTVWLGAGTLDASTMTATNTSADNELYISIDERDASVNTLVLSTRHYRFVEMDILPSRKLTVVDDLVIGDGSEGLAILYVNKNAVIEVGGDVIIGGSATLDMPGGNGALIMAESDLNIDGILAIGGSASSVCGLGTVQFNGATNITAQALELCGDQSKLALGSETTLTLKTDQKEELKQHISQGIIVLESTSQSNIDTTTTQETFSVEYANGVTTLSVVKSSTLEENNVETPPNEINAGCPQDVKLMRQLGSTTTTTNDSIVNAVTILDQNTSSVTVNLHQIFSNSNSGIDMMYYTYRKSSESAKLKGWTAGDPKCYLETSVPYDTGSPVDTVNILCSVLQPIAFLEVCLVDNVENGNLLPLNSNVDVSSLIPKCCHHSNDSIASSSAAEEQSGVCYVLEISCSPSPSNCADDQSLPETSSEEQKRKRRRTTSSNFLRR